MADLTEMDPNLTVGEYLSAQGCGAGTENACFALALGEVGMRCMLAGQDEAANMAGIRLGWRLNIDPEDGIPWCPKAVIEVSKRLDEYPAPSA